jgi:hypothetical protein
MERYCEIIAAMKVRTENKKRRHISTREAIRLLENFGIETEGGLVQVPPSVLPSVLNWSVQDNGTARAIVSPLSLH